MSLLDVNSDLRHFLMVTYKVHPSKVEHFLDGTGLQLNLRRDGDQEFALLSVVNFLDYGFHFKHLPLGRWNFFQTNYRLYITANGKPAVWFWGTTLGSGIVSIPQFLWRLPWHWAQYEDNIEWEKDVCKRYEVNITSPWASAIINITDTGEKVGLLPGFQNMEEQENFLLNPFTGYFRRRDQDLGMYRVHHENIGVTVCKANALRFPLLERLGILEAGDDCALHSIMLSKVTNFDVFLPPHRVYDPGLQQSVFNDP